MPPPSHQTAPIGIFDSGVGGLTIWREITALLPSESTIYYSDHANCPYGSKSQREIIALSECIVRFLLAHHCKLIVVACNTATGLAIDALRQEFRIPFVGIEPGIKPAALQSRSGIIGVLATEGTFQGRLFKETAARFAGRVKILATAGAGLVELVEEGELASPRTEQLLRRYITPMLAQGMDHLVLGCTHYPLLEETIRRIIGPSVTIITPGAAVALRTQALLQEYNLLERISREKRHRFLSSGNSMALEQMLRTLGIKALVEKPVPG